MIKTINNQTKLTISELQNKGRKIFRPLFCKVLAVNILSFARLFLADGVADAEGFEFLEEFVGYLYLELVGEELYVPFLDRIV